MPTGTTTVNFGAFPGGGGDNRVTITGQAAILAGSLVEAWLRPEASADHSADEHLIENLVVQAGNITAGTGFDIYVECTLGTTYGVYNLNWAWA